MSTERPRYTVSVDQDLFRQIEDYKFKMRYSTRSDATVDLIEKGLSALNEKVSSKTEKSPAPAEPEAGESKLEMELFRRALYDLGFLREGQKLTPAQAEVILSVLHILQVTLAETQPDEQGDKSRGTGSL